MTEQTKIDEAYILIFSGGLGSRIIQTSFIRSLIKKRKLDNTNYPIVIIDNTVVCKMIHTSLNGQNIVGMQIPEYSGPAYPQDPHIFSFETYNEHPLFLDFWRNSFKQDNTSAHDLIEKNWKRTYSFEYNFNLNKSIHLNKMKAERSSFIGNLYSKSTGLDYDNKFPMIEKTQNNDKLTSYINSLNKPYVLLHLGMDRTNQDLSSVINFKTHKVWSLQKWQGVVNALKHKYNFIQVHAHENNPSLDNVVSIKVEDLNSVLQLLENKKCSFFISIDSYMCHLAAAIEKRGIVLWGSTSPNIWGWQHNINIWNQKSCPDIACWRPGEFDIDMTGKSWVCDHYSCMNSITVDQVLKNVLKLENELNKDKDNGVLKL